MRRHTRSDLDQLSPMIRVIKTRLAAAENALQVEIKSLNKIECEIQERQSKVNLLYQDLVQLQRFLSGEDYCGSKTDANGNGKVSSRIETSEIRPASSGIGMDAVSYQLGLDRRYWINYDLEREHYYLDLTYQEKTEQLLKVNSARQNFKALQCKVKILDQNLHNAQKARQSAVIKRQESEYQDSAVAFSLSKGGIS